MKDTNYIPAVYLIMDIVVQFLCLLTDGIDESAMQDGFGKRLCLLLNAADGMTPEEFVRKLNVK